MAEKEKPIPKHLDVLISDNMGHLEDFVGARLYILRESVGHVLADGLRGREAMLEIANTTLDEVLHWVNVIGRELSEVVDEDFKPFKLKRSYTVKQ